MFETLTQRLSRALQRVRGKGRITEANIKDVAREIRVALLEADVALSVAKSLIKRVHERALGKEVEQSINPGQAFIKIVHDEIIDVLGTEDVTINKRDWPTIVMVVGLQGVGKTTTTAKLARHLSKSANEVLLASMDVYRPAAQDQLRTLANELGMHFLESKESDPIALAIVALEEAKLRGSRWLFIDTAGRLHLDNVMMSEIKDLQKVLDPTEILYVVDAMAGQDAVNSANAFNETIPLTGVVVTKTDGDARGGAILSIREVTGLPIKFIGTGEKIDAIDIFHPDRMADRILGMGDVISLVERAQDQFDLDQARKINKKIAKNKFGFDDFLSQIKQVQKMGSMKDLVGMIPGANKMIGDQEIDDDAFKFIEVIIGSMTPKERTQPDILDQSRRKRIANGSGRDISEVNQLIKQFDQMSKMMKMMQGGKANQMMQMFQNQR